MSARAQAHAPTQAARPAKTAPAGLLQRKCACGGGAAGLTGDCDKCADKQKRPLQTKLEVGRADDHFEREADRLAEEVMRGPAHAAPPAAAPALRRRAVTPVGPAASGTADAPPSVQQTLDSPGQPLDAPTRTFMEARFGHDFGRVRVHADARAAESARAVDALAYTSGADVVFAEGHYAPHTAEGRRLIAHELTHVLQQSGGRDAALKSAPRPALQMQQAPGAAAANTNAWKCGDISLDAQAKTDVVKTKVFFSDSDRTHIKVNEAGKLCYDTKYGSGSAQPEDSYRWGLLKEIVDGGRAEILKVSASDKFKTRTLRIVKGGRDTLSEEQTSLGGKGGLFLERPATAKKTYPAETVFTGISAKDDYAQIYYTRLKSLAHEFFGHLWLATKAVPYLHPPTLESLEKDKQETGEKWKPGEKDAAKDRLKRLGTLEERHKVTDPFNRPYTSDVGSFIRNYAGAEEKIGAPSSDLDSPTLGVGTAPLMTAIREIYDAGTSDKLKKGKPVPPAVKTAWQRVNANYRALKLNKDIDTRLESNPGLGKPPEGGPPAYAPLTARWVRSTMLFIIGEKFGKDERAAFMAFIRSNKDTLSSDLCLAIEDKPC